MEHNWKKQYKKPKDVQPFQDLSPTHLENHPEPEDFGEKFPKMDGKVIGSFKAQHANEAIKAIDKK